MKQEYVLITGGTGSFGQGFIDLLLRDWDGQVRTYSRDEHKIRQAREKFGLERFDTRMGDIRDKDRLRLVLRGIDYVVHAAALKQAPLGEVEPTEFAETNIFGTKNLIECCLESRSVKKVLFISTDKAVHPINLYGATKMVAEKMIVQANSMRGKYGPLFSAVRYGNVAGTAGSIVPKFKSLGENELVPITNPKATRFWLTLNQANRFVYDRLQDMNGGEVFVPKIPSVKIVDVAEAVCPGRELNVIGDRDGDKLHESLIAANERFTSLNGYFSLSHAGATAGLNYSSDQNEFLTVQEIRKDLGVGYAVEV